MNYRETDGGQTGVGTKYVLTYFFLLEIMGIYIQ